MTLIEADGDVVDVDVVTNHVHVVVDNLSMPSGAVATGRAILEADHAILATGLETRVPAFATEVMDHPSFVRHPYSQTGLERLVNSVNWPRGTPCATDHSAAPPSI